MDDYNRKGEQETITDLKSLLATLNYDFITGFYAGDKSQAIVASSKFRYLESL